ncbi:hypothetical protein LINPERPRIM_LOCUS29522 [Linum perenne]
MAVSRFVVFTSLVLSFLVLHLAHADQNHHSAATPAEVPTASYPPPKIGKLIIMLINPPDQIVGALALPGVCYRAGQIFATGHVVPAVSGVAVFLPVLPVTTTSVLATPP